MATTGSTVTDISSDVLSERLQSLIHPPFPLAARCCSMCRVQPTTTTAVSTNDETAPDTATSDNDTPDTIQLFRCTRCMAAHYCGRACQKKHWKLHKNLCQYVHQEKTETIQQLEEGRGYDPNEQLSSFGALGAAYTRMGYIESDTVPNGLPYYQQAVFWFWSLFQCMGQEQGDYSVASLVLFGILLVGGNQNDLNDWVATMETHYGLPRVGSTAGADGQCFQYRYHWCLLLALMKQLAEKGQSSIGDDDREMMDLEHNIRATLESIRSNPFYSNDSLEHLKHSIPFSEEHALHLFPAEVSPPDLWPIFQDAFFTFPGVRSILDEFVPDEDGEEGYE